MNVLLIGSGGREHALAWKISASPILDMLFCAPGNPGIGQLATCVGIDVSDHAAIAGFCRENHIDLVIVGPEAPLVAGLADDLVAKGVRVFGPTARAAQLEGSKAFTKELCDRFDIPTAAYARFNNAVKAKAYVRQKGAPIVVKADGLAAGKGVTVASTVGEACVAIEECFEGAFGQAGAEVIVEECLVGEEASFFCLCDGNLAVPLTSAQDHKRVGEGDTGPNTGGMGAYSPASVMTPEITERVMKEIVEPTMDGMRALGAPFTGILYAGLMLTGEGPKLIEYNVRFGDPECQVLMPRMQDDFLLLASAAADGVLGNDPLRWSDEAAATVVMAAEGYPAAPRTGTAISGVSEAETYGAIVFHAGTAMKDGNLVASGGRVLNVTALGKTVTSACHTAYAAIDRIEWPHGFYRRDIGWREIEREKAQ